MIDHMYTVPVYTRTLQFAYMHRRDWNEATALGPRPWASNILPRLNLGPASGKTTAAVNYAEQFSDAVLVTPTQAQADNISRRHTSVRAFSRDYLDKLPPHHFDSTQPLFVFDDTPATMTLDVLVKFKPTRFIHLGVWA